MCCPPPFWFDSQHKYLAKRYVFLIFCRIFLLNMMLASVICLHLCARLGSKSEWQRLKLIQLFSRASVLTKSYKNEFQTSPNLFCRYCGAIQERRQTGSMPERTFKWSWKGGNLKSVRFLHLKIPSALVFFPLALCCIPFHCCSPPVYVSVNLPYYTL